MFGEVANGPVEVKGFTNWLIFGSAGNKEVADDAATVATNREQALNIQLLRKVFALGGAVRSLVRSIRKLSGLSLALRV